MKNKILRFKFKALLLIITVIFCSAACQKVYAQNITNTLGTNGIFSIKDASSTFFTLTQTTGQVNILKTLRLEATTSSTTGVIYKGTDRLLHTYNSPVVYGQNVFLGLNSGNFTMTGNQNHHSSDNTGVGAFTLSSITTGYQNSALGSYALQNTTTGLQNSAFGLGALYSNTTGNYNTAIGNEALYYNISTSLNTAIGYKAQNMNIGTSNVAVGSGALSSNRGGSNNTAVGPGALNGNTSGDQNTAIGPSAGNNITTGSRNTVIGYNAQVPSNTGSNQLRIGDVFLSYAGIQVAWTVTSDRKWKQDITPVKLGLGFISKLNPVSYVRNNDELKKTEYGLIAQEVEQVLKEEGVENSGMLTITDKGDYELRYNDLLAPMIKAIQELKTENDKLSAESEKLQIESAIIKTENEEFRQKLSKYELIQESLVVEIEKLKSKSSRTKEVNLGGK